MQQFSAKEKYLLTNTLNCVPVLLQGHAVLIELINEQQVAGRIESADGQMNITLSEVVFIDRNGLQYPFEQFMVRERMVRQIHIPDYMEMETELKNWAEHGWLSYKPRQPKKKAKPTFKQRRAERRHKEIVEEIAKQNEKPA